MQLQHSVSLLVNCPIVIEKYKISCFFLAFFIYLCSLVFSYKCVIFNALVLYFMRVVFLGYLFLVMQIEFAYWEELEHTVGSPLIDNTTLPDTDSSSLGRKDTAP